MEEGKVQISVAHENGQGIGQEKGVGFCFPKNGEWIFVNLLSSGSNKSMYKIL